MRSFVPLARYASPGMPVRQQDLTNPAAPQHRILNVEQSDLNALVKITTNYGIWLFHPDEQVVFPRRPDNSHRDWRGATPPPFPTELAIGDLLDPKDGAIAWKGASPSDWRDAAQHVTSVTRNPARPNVISLNTFSAYTGQHRHIFIWNEHVIFPRAKEPRHTGYAQVSPYELQAYGPYLLNDTEAETGPLIFIIRHPSGGGRWPRWLTEKLHLGENVFVSRPPGKKEIWPPYVNTEDRWGRHPRDPATGQPATRQIPPERLARAIALYTEYRDRRALAVPPPPRSDAEQ
jgi:hypothetical protein